MIYFVKRCVFKFLNKRQTGCTEIDMWKFESEVDVWNEFINHYTKLIINDNATFHREYTYQLEVIIKIINNFKKYEHFSIIVIRLIFSTFIIIFTQYILFFSILLIIFQNIFSFKITRIFNVEIYISILNIFYRARKINKFAV